MIKTLELVGGPPASGKSTYVRREYANGEKHGFRHLDFDAMVVREFERSYGSGNEYEIRDHVSMVYGRERSDVMYSDVARVTVDWPFCDSHRAEEYIKLGAAAGRQVECNFFTAHASEAWKRSLTRHVAGEYNAFTVFLKEGHDIADALRPSFKMFLEAHRDLPSTIERVFPLVERAKLWDNNERDSMPTLIAECEKGGEINVLNRGRWERFQYKREINADAGFEVLKTVEEEFEGKARTLFDVKYVDLIQRGREKTEYALRF